MGRIEHEQTLVSKLIGFLYPFMLLLAFYVIFNGHNTPGGGFQGGAILASVAISRYLVHPYEDIKIHILQVAEKILFAGILILPVTTLHEVLAGYPVDYLLYANNYEEVDSEHPVIQPFDDAEAALAVFREGAAMAKGITTATGLVHSYFANPFGAPQKRGEHEAIARYFFERLHACGSRIGMLRTRLGLEGYEMRGPEEAARAILEHFFS